MPAPAFTPPVREFRRLRLRLAATRAWLVFNRAGTGLATVLTLVIAVLAGEMTLDWLVHLPWLARACLVVPAIAGAGWILWKDVLQTLVRMPSDLAVACAIERVMPNFQTRLIASIQLGRDATARQSALVGALIRETTAIATGLDFRKAVSGGKLVRSGRLLAAMVLVSGGLVWWMRGDLGLLLERALLLTTRLPTRTQITHIDCPARIAAGDDLNIDVEASGVIPPDGLIVSQAASGESQYKLERGPGDHFHAVIQSVPESLTLRVRLNDAESDPIAIQVFAPPAVLAIHCTEIFPAYTKLDPMERPTGDLSLLAGSMLRLAITASGPVRKGTIHLAGLESEAALAIDPNDRRQASVEVAIPTAGLTGFSIRLVDDNGIASRETAVYRIDIVPDHPPVIRITHPGVEEAATAAATELVAFSAADDFGVAKVSLHYMVNHGEEKLVDFDLGGDTPRQIDRHFEWKLPSLKVAPGSVVEYWLEADDANDVTGPGRGYTDHFTIKVVTDAEKRAELAGRANDALGSLEELSQGQDDLAARLGALILQKPEGVP